MKAMFNIIKTSLFEMEGQPTKPIISAQSSVIAGDVSTINCSSVSKIKSNNGTRFVLYMVCKQASAQ